MKPSGFLGSFVNLNSLWILDVHVSIQLGSRITTNIPYILLLIDHRSLLPMGLDVIIWNLSHLDLLMLLLELVAEPTLIIWRRHEVLRS